MEEVLSKYINEALMPVRKFSIYGTASKCTLLLPADKFIYCLL